MTSINHFDIIVFLRQLATLISAGIPIMQSCDMLAKIQEKKSLHLLIHSIRWHIASGKPLSYSLNLHQHYFDVLTCQLVKIGEHTGKLDEMLVLIANHHEKNFTFKKKLQQIIFYPCIMILVTLWMTAGLLLFVIPRFAELFQDSQEQLPALTYYIFYFSTKLRFYLIMMLAMTHIAVLIIPYHDATRHKMNYYLKRWLNYMPPIKQYLLKIIFAQFARHLAITFSAGISISNALKLVAATHTDKKFTSTITLLLYKVSSGQTLHHAMQTLAYFPEFMIHMVKIGEETGKLDYMLAKTADFIEAEIDQITVKLGKLIEPLIMLFLGALIGGIVIGMYLPIFKLGTTF
ncbi:MAG TPA: type II secretion system F family protein [Gammaproteobacteria bacterium]|nr:type II secretion system F family protein [Gammaproteobacteria bacterium]